MIFHFVFIIIIFGTSLLCSSILVILLTLVIFSRLCLIIQLISSRLWLIIRWILLSKILPIMNWFSFTKTISLCNYYIYANCWKFLLIAIEVPLIIISSSWTFDLFPWSLIFLEDYDALLNDLFVVFVVVVGHP